MAFQVGVNARSSIKSGPLAVGSRISPKGSPAERIWILAEKPLAKDADKGFLFSSPMGWSYDKLLGEAGINKYYCTYPDDEQVLVAELNKYQPPIIVALDTSARVLLDGIKGKGDVGLWAGSLLVSNKLSFPHYIIPTFGPETCIQDWTERQVVKYIDFGKIRDEHSYYLSNGVLQPLPSRILHIDLELHTLLYKLNYWKDDPAVEYISVDIETVYPKEKSEFYGHPGYPITVGIATGPGYGISFSMFQETKEQTIKLWRALEALLNSKKIIGQNFHSFDSWFFDMLLGQGTINRFNVFDTMYRHAVLWPELSHKLQFLTRQYTRQPYYKSEGHGWNPKNLGSLKKYNALDVTVTFEVFNAQEEEFDARPHLR